MNKARWDDSYIPPSTQSAKITKKCTKKKYSLDSRVLRAKHTYTNLHNKKTYYAKEE